MATLGGFEDAAVSCDVVASMVGFIASDGEGTVDVDGLSTVVDGTVCWEPSFGWADDNTSVCSSVDDLICSD